MKEDEVTDLIIDMLENSPHKVVYEPKYPGELYVVSEDYRKLARKTARAIIKKLEKKLDSVVEYYPTFEDVQEKINECEGKHIQQVAYSSYHKSLTQACITCKKIRTSLKKTLS